MKKIFQIVQLLFVLSVCTQQATAQQVMKDDFTLSDALAEWQPTNISGAPVVQEAGGLVYTGYVASGAGNAVLALNSTSNSGITHPAMTDATVHTSFMFQVNSASANDDLVMNYIGSPTTPLNEHGFVVKDNGGGLKFGLKVNGTATYAAATYVYGTTYLIVVKYDISSKVYSLRVNPTLPVEPAATLTSAAHSGAAPMFISQIQFNQRVGQTAKVDGIRVANSWADLHIESSSTLLVAESFNGLTGPIDGGSSGWTQTSCCNGLTVAASGLTHTSGTFFSGNAARDAAGEGMFTKTFPTVSTGVIYVSFLVDENTDDDNSVRSNINFYNSGQTNWNSNQGFVLDNGDLSLKNGDLASNVVNGPALNLTDFVVLGYNTGTGLYSLWVNPTLGTTTPPLPNITATSSVITSVSGISIGNPNTNSQPIYDEIRVSTVWGDVVKSAAPDPIQAKNLTLSYNGSNIQGSFAISPGLSYLVVRKVNEPSDFTPIEGANYSVGPIGDSEIVSMNPGVFNDNVSFDPELTYYYKVYSFVDGTNENYNPHSPAQGIISTEPELNAPSITFNSATETSITFSVLALTTVDGKLVLRSAAPFFPEDPIDGKPYYVGTTFSNTSVAYIGNASGFTDTGLTPGTTYNYKVYTYNGTSTYTNIKTLNTTTKQASTRKAEPAAQPLSITYTNRDENSIDFDLQEAGAEDGYLVIYKAGSSPTNGAPVDGVSYSTNQSLGGGNVAYRGSSHIGLDLPTVSSNTQYFIDVYAYSHTTTDGDNYYNYRQLSPLESSAFTLANAPGGTPSGLSFTATTNTSFTATFSGSGDGFIVIRSAVSSPNTNPVDGTAYLVNDVLGNGVVISNKASTGFTDSGLTPGTTYFYRIFSYNGSAASTNYSTLSLSGSRATAPADPVAIAAASVTQTSFTAACNSPATATSYRIDVSISNTFATFVSTYNDLSIGSPGTSVTGLSPGTQYYYRMRAVSATGTSGNSNVISIVTAPPDPVASAATSITQTTFTANWAAATGATGYFLDVATDAGFTAMVSGYSNKSVGNVLTSAVNTSISAGTTYFYRVRAASSGGTSGNSNTISLITVPGNPVATSATAHAQTAFAANWGAVTGATGYRLDVATTSVFTGGTFIAGYQDLNVGNVITYNVNTNLVAGTTYYFRVRALNASGTSAGSNVITVLTLPPGPVATAATAADRTSFVAHWNTTTSATSYVIDISSNGFTTFTSTYNNFNVGNVLLLPIIGLSGGIDYAYRIRAVNASGQSSNSNIIHQITTPEAPVATAAGGITTSSFVAQWETTAGAASYRLDVSVDNFVTYLAGFNNLVVAGIQSTVGGLAEGVSYKYRVRAVNATGTSVNSSAVSVLTVPPVPVANTPTGITTTAFTVTWTAVDGATNYLLDVSADNFATFLDGYNNKSTSLTTESLTGLSPNTTYSYRVRATSSSGTSGNSNVITTVTYPSAPVAIAATLMTQIGFTANWNAQSGITSFELDVSSDDFATNVSGLGALVVTGTSIALPGLTPGTTYKYRLRAVNATGTSANSNPISTITIPGTPVANVATAITQTGFTANWNTVTAADDYLLDVSTQSTFTSFVAGYNAKPVSSNSGAITGLTPGTVHYYRVRARNASGQSPDSGNISQITIPANPETIFVTIKNNISFIASWKPVTGAESYELDVTTFVSNFATFVPNYNSHVITGGESSEDQVSGLSPGTAYRFRIRAVNAGGKSSNSNTTSVQTDGGSAQSLDLSLIVPNSGIFTGTSVNVTGTVSNAIGIVTATLTYSKITETESHEKSIPVVNGAYTVVVDDSMLDEIGTVLSITATDEVGGSKTKGPEYIYRGFTDASSPTLLTGSFSGDRRSMRIISIPYDLNDNAITSIFVSLGAYDKKSWRLAHYQDGENVENEDRLLKIERGLGYWFNARGNINAVKTSQGSAAKNDKTKPFRMTLAKGWNQIGNPFPFAIDWSDVLADNSSVTNVSALKIYSGDKQNFDNGNKIEVFGGGFVHADNATSLDLNVSLKSRANGSRMQRVNSDLGNDSWEVPFSLSQGTSVYDIGGIGMDPNANEGKDHSDEMRLPRLDEYLDITFDHTGGPFRYFTKDVLPTSTQATWKFLVQSSGKDETATLQWNNAEFGSNIAKIFLLDIASLQMIDMRSVDHYSFTNPGSKEFKVYFSADGKDVVPDIFGAGAPYPNPSSAAVSMSVALPAGQGDFNIELVAFDLMGRQVRTIQRDLPAGIHQLSWDGNDLSGNRVQGLYLLRARVNNAWLDQSHRVVME